MNPQITQIIEENDCLRFTLAGVNVSLANALRRIILNDIYTVVFRTETYADNKCTITVNTSRQHNEMVKQRLSCIPIYSTDLTILPDNYIMEVDVSNDTDHIMYVTTEHFRIKNKQNGNYLTEKETRTIFPADKKTGYFIDFIRLRPRIGDIPGEQLKLSCEFSVANTNINSMFNVVNKCAYGYTIDVAAADSAWANTELKLQSDGLTEDEIEFNKRNFYLLDAQRYFVENSFDFVVRTLGVFSNQDIVKKACVIMQNKLIDFVGNLESNTVSILTSESTVENSFDVILENEDYTLGKAIEFYLYEHFYRGNKTLTYCGFKKIHPHDSDSRIRVAYENKVTVDDVRANFKKACVELQEVYTTIYKMF